MNDIHQEHHFEEELCLSLQRNGWRYSPDDSGFDREHFLYTADLCEWLQTAWPIQWKALFKKYGSVQEAAKAAAAQVRKNLNHQGTLHWLRHSVEMQGLRTGFTLAEFRPSTLLNAEVCRRYGSNILRVVRQVHHSINNAHLSLDLVFFLNGLPVATTELKSEMTQTVQDAIQQYRIDRNPFPKGGKEEPLLAFGRGALVHFAISQDEAYMTTRLEGRKTFFLPFNRGNHGGAGNAPVPGKFPTCYLWEDIWRPDQWLDLLGKYLVAEKERGKLKKIIFPRFHQLDSTRRILEDVADNGPGGKYLIQHSAGSGKTKSIAWTAHFLSNLHRDNRKIFKSIIVISDRTVLDEQLRRDIEAFTRTSGVVASITGEHSSKSRQLGKALEENRQIIVCTLQTFPFLMEEARKLMKEHHDWRFAIIADEAHSSMAGDTNAALKQLLTPEEAADLADGGEVDVETMLEADMTARHADGRITYVAFTATPKAKTLELFGIRDEQNIPHPFHVYTMRQAIEEGFILDVLQNYTTITMAWKLGHADGSDIDPDNPEDPFMRRFVDKKQGATKLINIVKLHSYTIAQKVDIVVKHYMKTVRHCMENGEEAKAMVVLGSRQEAIRWQKTLQTYIQKRRLDIDSLVAFSGSLTDEESFPGMGDLSEKSSRLNPELKSRDIRKAFIGSEECPNEFQILLVANKFQTGFDEPRLCGMYINRKLGGVQAVQTLSRLNRCHPGKDHVYVVDFVNKEEDILAAFSPYYETACIGEVTDPDIIYDLYQSIDHMELYTQETLEQTVRAIKKGCTQQEVYAILKPVQTAICERYKTAVKKRRHAAEAGDEETVRKCEEELQFLKDAKSAMSRYIRAYVFLSQITNYESTILEKHYLFYKMLVRLLKFDVERVDVDLSDVQLTHYAKKGEKTTTIYLTSEGDVGTALLKEDAAPYAKKEEALAIMIRQLNELYGEGLTEEDRIPFLLFVSSNLLQDEKLVRQAACNTFEQFMQSPDLNKAFQEALFASQEKFTRFAMEAIQQEEKLEELKHILLEQGKLYTQLRDRGLRKDTEEFLTE